MRRLLGSVDVIAVCGLAIASASAAIAQPVYVSARFGSDDTGDGSQSEPFATIDAALDHQFQAARPVYVDIGDYNRFALPSEGYVLGGFDGANGWTRDPANNITRVTGLGVSGGGSDGVLDGLTLQGTVGSVGNSVGLRVQGYSNLVVSNCVIESGVGRDGSAGATGRRGRDGSPGQRGQPGCEDSGFACANCSRPSGGSGGLGASPVGNSGRGGTGGRGGLPGRASSSGANGARGGSGFRQTTAGEQVTGSAFRGLNGLASLSGLGNWNPSSPFVGGDGGAGPNGTLGQAGSTGQFNPSMIYTPNVAGQGTGGQGGAGGGGGGGGGGGTSGCDSYGGAGGGGSGGGSGGEGGFGGQGGFASIGIAVINGGPMAILDNRFVIASGGRGGNGGFGGSGGASPFPSTGGGNRGNNYGGSGEQDDGSNGARGGRGGTGGTGGRGGGGAGGPSVGIAILGNDQTIAVGDNSFEFAAPAAGGAQNGVVGPQSSVVGTASTDPVIIADCNNNGVHDIVDIADGTSMDFDFDNIPDECDCLGDYDNDGAIGVDDFTLFRSAFANGSMQANLDMNLSIDYYDYVTFFELLSEGCD